MRVCALLLLQENNLPFEGFLEALCRLSMLKALPTDAELEETGCSDAGVFMQRLYGGHTGLTHTALRTLNATL